MNMGSRSTCLRGQRLSLFISILWKANDWRSEHKSANAPSSNGLLQPNKQGGDRSGLPLSVCRLKLVSRQLSAALVGCDFVGDLLAFVEATHASTLDSADMNENIRAACSGLNEAEALLGVKPLYGTCLHVRSFQDASARLVSCTCMMEPIEVLEFKGGVGALAVKGA
jgi:hypothetical protein